MSLKLQYYKRFWLLRTIKSSNVQQIFVSLFNHIYKFKNLNRNLLKYNLLLFHRNFWIFENIENVLAWCFSVTCLLLLYIKLLRKIFRILVLRHFKFKRLWNWIIKWEDKEQFMVIYFICNSKNNIRWNLNIFAITYMFSYHTRFNFQNI